MVVGAALDEAAEEVDGLVGETGPDDAAGWPAVDVPGEVVVGAPSVVTPGVVTGCEVP